jgi:tetratricopeptide (TPR) repeat protein
MVHDVFISYSSKDKPVTDYICANIEAAGICCWIAPRDIAPGEDWPTAIANAIPLCHVMVLVFTANSNASKDVSNEIHLAANNNLVIIPFKIENVQPEPGKNYYLARTHWLDAVNPPTQKQISTLISRVKALLSVTETPQERDDQTAIITPNTGNKSSEKVSVDQGSKSTRLEPKNAKAYIKRGDKNYEKTHYQDALANYTRAIELDPKDAMIYYNRGDTYYELKDYTAALADFTRAIELDPINATTNSRHNFRFNVLKKFLTELEKNNRAIELHPKSAKNYNNRGEIYFNLNDYPSALADYNKAIELKPKYAEAYLNRGNSYSELGNSLAALDDYSRAIELNPEDSHAYGRRGIEQDIRNNYSAAIADYTKACEIDPKDDLTILLLAYCYVHQGNAERACEWLRRAIVLNREHLGMLCTSKGLDAIRDSKEFKSLIDEFGGC